MVHQGSSPEPPATLLFEKRGLYVKPPLTWVSHRRPSRKAGSPYHGIGRGAVRRRSRERHRIAVRHAADPCGEEEARRRAQGGHRRGARLPSLRPGRPVALPEVRQPLLRAQGPGPRRRAAVAVPRLRQDVLRAHARPARIVEAARVGVDVLRRVHGRRAPPAGDGCPRRGLPLHGVVHAHAGLRGHGAAHPGLPAGDLPRRRHPGHGQPEGEPGPLGAPRAPAAPPPQRARRQEGVARAVEGVGGGRVRRQRARRLLLRHMRARVGGRGRAFRGARREDPPRRAPSSPTATSPTASPPGATGMPRSIRGTPPPGTSTWSTPCTPA